MIVFPAIDLKGGQVVRLSEGDMARATVYGDDPAAQAMLFAGAGSQYLHVVDLDGSFAGRAENREAVEAILKVFPGHVQLGGGIRTALAVDGWFDLGVARVVMGSAALAWPRVTPSTRWSRLPTPPLAITSVPRASWLAVMSRKHSSSAPAAS